MACSRMRWAASWNCVCCSIVACAAAAARSSGVSARPTWLVVMPLLALNSVRALSVAEAGKASPQTLRPASFQQYSFFLTASCAPAGADSTAAVRASAMGAYSLFMESCEGSPDAERARKYHANCCVEGRFSACGFAAVSGTVGQQPLALCDQVGIASGEFQQVGEAGDGHHRQAVFVRDSLCRRASRDIGGDGFLPVQGDDDARGDAAGVTDDRQRLADRGTGGDHVVDDQHALSCHRRADQGAAFPMCLGFLAVEGQWQVAAAAREFAGHGGGERDALVGGPEQQVEAHAVRLDRIGIAAGELCQQGTGVEESGVEEIGAAAAGLEGEVTKTQRVRAQGELEEAGAVIVRHGVWRWVRDPDCRIAVAAGSSCWRWAPGQLFLSSGSRRLASAGTTASVSLSAPSRIPLCTP